jgi:16S rRNA (uracil1498-N3)-methyltransferase
MRRFYVPSEQIHCSYPYLCGDEARHLLQVLRMKVGDQVILFDNTHQEYQARISSITGKQVYFEIEGQLNIVRESGLQVTVGLPIIRPQPFEWILQKGTELGVVSFQPYYSAHSRRNFEKSEMDSRMKRWRRIIIEAAKQCKRSRLPELYPAVPFSVLIKEDWGEVKIIPFEKETARTLKEFKEQSDPRRSVHVLIGPEGGFPEEEVQQAEKEGFIPVSLGPRILRSETAAIALICLLQFLWGDMGLAKTGEKDALS